MKLNDQYTTTERRAEIKHQIAALRFELKTLDMLDFQERHAYELSEIQNLLNGMRLDRADRQPLELTLKFAIGNAISRTIADSEEREARHQERIQESITKW